MNFSKWWLNKAAALYRWLEQDAKADGDVTYEEYKIYKKYADEAEYILKAKEK